MLVGYLLLQSSRELVQDRLKPLQKLRVVTAEEPASLGEEVLLRRGHRLREVLAGDLVSVGDRLLGVGRRLRDGLRGGLGCHRGCLARLPRRLRGLVADVLKHPLQRPGLRGLRGECERLGPEHERLSRELGQVGVGEPGRIVDALAAPAGDPVAGLADYVHLIDL